MFDLYSVHNEHGIIIGLFPNLSDAIGFLNAFGSEDTWQIRECFVSRNSDGYLSFFTPGGNINV
jgi:hypothetical protein